MSFFKRQRLVLLLAAVITIAIPGISYAQLDLKGKAIETLTNGVMKELDKKFAEMVAKEALSAAVKANIVKNLSEMSRPVVKNIIDGAASGKLPNVAEVVNSVIRDITPRVQELVTVALTDGGAGSVAQVAGQAPITASALSTGSAPTAVIVGYDDEKDFTVEIIKDSNSARITKYNGKSTELRIPPRIDNRPVTEIGERVFDKKGLVSVVIPESVIFIGNLAFANNQIGSVSIGANVYIATNAFENTGYNFFSAGFYNSQGRRAGVYSNSWRWVSAVAPQPGGAQSAAQTARPGSNTTVSASTPVAATSAPPPAPAPVLSSIVVISPTSEWMTDNDSNSSSKVSINKEQINGQERNVLTIDVNVSSKGWAGAVSSNENIVQGLHYANGVRFKVLGDGKSWRVNLATNNVTDNSWFGIIISTQKDKVTSVDIPLALVKQPNWGKKTRFNTDNITGIRIERNIDTSTGASVIKIFDFEIY